jgi:hypothetical protein
MTTLTAKEFETLVWACRYKRMLKYPGGVHDDEHPRAPAFTFYEAGLESRRINRTHTDKDMTYLHDPDASGSFTTLEEWYADVKPKGEAKDHLLPLSKLYFGALDDPNTALDAHEIETVLYWTHRPLTMPKKPVEGELRSWCWCC